MQTFAFGALLKTKTVLLGGALLLPLQFRAAAAAIDLVWDPAVPGNPYEARFDCNTDAGSHDLVLRFSIVGSDSIEVNSIHAVISLGSESGTLPEW
jgi:hypothetical protein